jgi:hypothetical protein
MKNLVKLALILLLTFVALSCKKESSISNLNGTWELRSVVGGQLAGASPIIAAKNGNQFKFNQQNYERYVDGKLIESGTFTLKAVKVKINNDEANFSMLTNTNLQQYIKLSSNDLVIFTGVIAADGFESHYIKL